MESCLQEQCEYRIPFILVFAFLFSTVNNKQVSLLTLVKNPNASQNTNKFERKWLTKMKLVPERQLVFFVFFFVKPKVHQYKHIKGVLQFLLIVQNGCRFPTCHIFIPTDDIFLHFFILIAINCLSLRHSPTRIRK